MLSKEGQRILMQPKIVGQSLIVCLLAASQSIFYPTLALVNNTSDFGSDLNIGQNSIAGAEKTDKRRSIILAPKWSLPFQGQLGSAATDDSAQTNNAARTNNVGQTNNAEAQTKAANDLSLFKQNKVQVLSLTPLDNNLIADAGIPIETKTEGNTPAQNGKFISGEVSVWDGPFNGDRIVNHLLETHFENSPEGQKLDAQVKRLGGLKHKTIDVSKDGLEEIMGYQGFAPSARGGQIVLESPSMKIRNIAWAEYARQRYIDKIHAQVVSSLMQLAEGIGNSENEHGAKTIASGKEELSALVGNEEAERAIKALTTWLNNTQVPYSTFAQTPWNTSEHNKKLETILTAAVAHDPVIGAVTKRVMNYANPGKLRLGASTVIQTTLNGITVFSPLLIPSISSATLEVVFKLVTGGTEQNKLERELLLDKRIQSRLKVLTQESSLALDNYRFALVTKNPPLLAFSQEVLENLTGDAKVQTLLSSADALAQDYDRTNKIVPEMKGVTKEAKVSKVNFVVKNIGQMAVTDFKKYDD